MPGSFVLMLHSHLPFYRMAGMWPFGEENLYECMLETYIPLLNMLRRLVAKGISPGITLGLTPVLLEQLNDAHLQQGFVDYMTVRIQAAQNDINRVYPEHAEHRLYLAHYTLAHLSEILDDFETVYQRQLIPAFAQLQQQGHIEITTSGATHGFSPLLGTPESVRAQFQVGIDAYQRYFGQAPKGVWLPECAYRPEKRCVNPETGLVEHFPAIEETLAELGLGYFFTEYSAVEGSDAVAAQWPEGGLWGGYPKQKLPVPETTTTATNESRHTYQAYWLKKAPVAVLARNNRASFQVWSAADGYPGDGAYREFHKKDTESGLHYWCITSKETAFGEKMLYDPVRAAAQTRPQAEHFVSLLNQLETEHWQATGEHALVCVSFDTELFGHWWFEGIQWLEHVLTLRQAVPARTYLAAHPPRQTLDLPESTWGDGGHYWVWDNPETHWMWGPIHRAERAMRQRAQQYATCQDLLLTNVLNQAFRELLLLESSDWPFLVTTGQATDYAKERFQGHVDRFWMLIEALDAGDRAALSKALAVTSVIDNPFASLDYRWYQPD